MTDNLPSLRRALADLSEHGGSTDMYERSLRRSRQLQRRRAVATAAAAAVVTIGGTIALVNANRPGPPAPAAVRPPAAGVAPSSPAYPECPPARTLEGLADLPKDWSFSRVRCAENWAAATPEGPGIGDGLYFFKYTPGTGWRYDGQGSALDCKKDLGLTKPAPFCTS